MAKKDDGTKVVGKNANKYRATAPIKIRHTSKNVTSGKNILADYENRPPNIKFESETCIKCMRLCSKESQKIESFNIAVLWTNSAGFCVPNVSEIKSFWWENSALFFVKINHLLRTNSGCFNLMALFNLLLQFTV